MIHHETGIYSRANLPKNVADCWRHCQLTYFILNWREGISTKTLHVIRKLISPEELDTRVSNLFENPLR